MYIVVDTREAVADGYVAGFAREGIPSLGFNDSDFRSWLETTSEQDLGAVQGILLGEMEGRPALPEMIRSHCRAPIIALSEDRNLDATLALFTAGIDDVVRKPVHVRELMARSNAVWRRVNEARGAVVHGRLRVHFNGQDPEVDGEPLTLPRRERHILEYLARHADRRITKTQLFNAIYGLCNEGVDETVVEGHISKLRRKLRERLGEDVIEARRYLGYRFVM